VSLSRSFATFLLLYNLLVNKLPLRVPEHKVAATSCVATTAPSASSTEPKQKASSDAHPTPSIAAPSVSRSPTTAPAGSKRFSELHLEEVPRLAGTMRALFADLDDAEPDPIGSGATP
jgi:hypothetical protein